MRKNLIAVASLMSFIVLSSPPVMAIPRGGDPPIVATLFDHANAFGRLEIIEHIYPSSDVDRVVSRFTGASGQTLVWTSENRTDYMSLPGGSIARESMPGGRHQFTFSSSSGASWSVLVDASGALVDSGSVPMAVAGAESVSISAMSSGVADELKNFLFSAGLVLETPDGLVATAQWRNGSNLWNCALAMGSAFAAGMAMILECSNPVTVAGGGCSGAVTLYLAAVTAVWHMCQFV